VPGRVSTDATQDRLLSDAATLWAAASSAAERGEAVNAVTLAWGSDIRTAEAVMVERQKSSSSRGFLQAASVIVQRLGEQAQSHGSAADLVALAREHLWEAAEPGLQRELSREWQQTTMLADLPAPRHKDFEAAARSRLGSMTPSAFVVARMAQARAAMEAAQHHRIAGSTPEAIQSSYESDLAVLEAYLVESAIAVGDPLLLTVRIRWELAARAISEIPGLPSAPVAAAERIRHSVGQALGPADGERLAHVLLPL